MTSYNTQQLTTWAEIGSPGNIISWVWPILKENISKTKQNSYQI